MQVWYAVVPERPREPGTVAFVADRNKAEGSSNSHRRDGWLLCGQCEQKLAHVVSILMTHVRVLVLGTCTMI